MKNAKKHTQKSIAYPTANESNRNQANQKSEIKQNKIVQQDVSSTIFQEKRLKWTGYLFPKIRITSETSFAWLKDHKVKKI